MMRFGLYCKIRESADLTAVQPDADDEYVGGGDYCAGESLNADWWWKKVREVPFLTINGSQQMVQVLEKACAPPHGNMKIMGRTMNTYGSSDPESGYTYMLVLGQSHVALHTWPEKKMMNIDIFTCGNEGSPRGVYEFIKNTFRPDREVPHQNARGVVRKHVHSTSEKPDRPEDAKPTNSPQISLLGPPGPQGWRTAPRFAINSKQFPVNQFF